MVVIVDACSLVELARYYIPFDDGNVLSNFIRGKFDSNEMILLDKILEECKFVAKGLAVNSLPFIEEKKYVIKTDNLSILAPKKFHRLLDNNYCVGIARKQLGDVEYSLAKDEYLKTGDAKVIIYVDHLIHNGCNKDDIVVVTEETENQNDGKLFKKLPLICEMKEIKTMNIAGYLKMNNVKVDWIIP